MLFVAPVRDEKRHTTGETEKNLFGFAQLHVIRSSIPAVTHVDYSARVQTVGPEVNPLYYRTLQEFDKKYDCPVIINTSFNVRGEPIVASPEDAYLCFMRTNMDYLIMGNILLQKESQKPLDNDVDWSREYELD